jgi:hypothetical protein
MIRSKVSEFSLKFRKKTEDKHASLVSEINKILSLKRDIINNSSHPLLKYLTIECIDADIFKLESDLDKVLQDKTKILASKSRIKWLEQGEKSNKYFLNLNKSFQNSSYFRSFLVDGIEIFDSKSKTQAVHQFYSSLYSYCPNDNPNGFLSSIDFNLVSPEHNDILKNPLTKTELVKILTSCGDTASGPDGIGYKLIKTCWSFYGDVLIDSWNYSITTKILPLSHRESVICLLGKKGKDKRVIGNLRPITLSNCDIKVITKAITKRCNMFLNRILNPHQTAYIPGRIVHDNLRSIDIVKDICLSKQIDGYLVSLDAKKAFDSVDHQFIDKVLEKFNFCNEFRSVVKLLYNQIYSRVLVNGHLTEQFPILRSVKQGDALSCVLFILCMETIIKTIETNTSIKNIQINQLKIPKVFAFADDIAVLVNDINSIQNVIKSYTRFSQVSGLYLNVDKTEVMRLHSSDGPQLIELTDTTKTSLSNGITICGRLFSCDYRLEYENNVLSKIDKLRKALESWNRRSLSIFGRNLILKTFGLSQLIYMMQNTHFSDNDIKQIERICFNFLWRKKADKIKAFERISRSKLKLPFKNGGINTPDIRSMSDALAVGQLIRSTSETCLHFIKELQLYCCNFNPNLIFQQSMQIKNAFLTNSIKTLGNLGNIMIDEILASDIDNKLSKYYFDLIASERTVSVVSLLTKNPIIRSQAKSMQKKFGIEYVGQLINEFKFPSCDTSFLMAKNIVDACGKLLNILANRKSLTYGLSFRDYFFISTNHHISSEKVTTKLIRTRLHNTNIVSISPQFTALKHIKHPKEREISFFLLHDVLLPNRKLYEMKLINSPLCSMCNVDQTSNHIFSECINAKTAMSVMIEYSSQISNNKVLQANSLSLIKRLCYLNKDKLLSPDIFRVAIQDRLNDLNNITNRLEKRKNLALINKITLL